MQIVIDMSEHEYEVALRDGWVHGFYSEKIKNGTPLPKRHGRLIDADAIVAQFKEHKKFYIDSYGGFFQFMPIEYKARCDEIGNCWADIINAQTVIEADKEVDE